MKLTQGIIDSLRKDFFKGMDLSYGNFEELYFICFDFISDCNFNGSNLQSSKFYHSKLKNVKLTNAFLENCILYDSDLRGADLTGSDLSNATITCCNIDKNIKIFLKK